MTIAIFCLGSGQAYRKEDGRPKSNNVNTQFFDACNGGEDEPKDGYHPEGYVRGKNLLLDGPQKKGGIYDPQKITTNVESAIKQITAWIATETTRPYKINLSGFSRGSTTCLRIANELQDLIDAGKITLPGGEILKRNDFEINIFAEDPVAGFTDKGNVKNRKIPSIVKNYVATIQMDEDRRGFNAQDKSRVIVESEKTNVTFLPMPGHHSASNSVKKIKTKEVAMLQHKLKYDFFVAHGHQFKKNPELAVSKLIADKVRTEIPALELYANAKKNRAAYKKRSRGFQHKDVPLPGKKRSFNDNLEDYVTDSFFVNQHERELFKRIYPKTFNYLFEKNRTDKLDPENTGFSANIETVKPELELMKIKNPQLLLNLQNANKVRKNENNNYEIVSPPQGISRIERCELLNSLQGKETRYENIGERLLSSLDKKLFEIASEYKRGKNETMGFSERNQSALMEQMRKEVREIINSEEEDHYEKLKNALDKIEANFLYLKESETNSELIKPMEELLKKYGREYQLVEHPKNAGYLSGKILQAVGQGVRMVGIGVADVMGAIGEPLARAGKRSIQWATSDWRLKTLILPVVGTVIGGALFATGWIIREGGRLIDKAGGFINRLGNTLVKNSKVHEVIKEPTSSALVNSSVVSSTSSIQSTLAFTDRNTPKITSKLMNNSITQSNEKIKSPKIETVEELQPVEKSSQDPTFSSSSSVRRRH